MITAERPAVHFTKEHHDSSMNDHPVSSRLPTPTGKISLHAGPKELCSLALGPGTPRNMDDFVYSGTPQFSMHVKTFTDGTLVNFAHSHVTCDLMGLEAILKAWCLVLAGKPEEVIPMIGYREDPFKALWDPRPKERHVLADKVLDGWRFKYWAMRSLYESWRYGSVQSRTLCIPKREMERLMRTARDDIKYDYSDTPADPDAFISEGDVVTALACRILAQYQRPGSSRETATLMALDPRNRVKSVFRQDAAYVQNSPTNIHVFCPADKALKLPLGQLALLVRRSIAAQTTEEQVRAAASMSVDSMKVNKMPVVFGDKDMATQFVSNWCKGHYLEKMDFTPAIVKEAPARPSYSKRGHPVYYQAVDPSHNTVSVISSVFVVTQKDYDENTWFAISMPEKMWQDLMEYLKELTGGYKAFL